MHRCSNFNFVTGALYDDDNDELVCIKRLQPWLM